MTLTLMALGALWSFVDWKEGGRGVRRSAEGFVYAAQLAVTGWLLSLADSATAIACTAVGAVALLSLRVPRIQKNVLQWVAAAAVIAIMLMLVDIRSLVTSLLGRDTTFTGRTRVWSVLLNESVNPLFGVGSYSFWIGERADRLAAHFGSFINEAHNGYLDLYLNVGLVGVCLCAAILAAGLRDSAQGVRGWRARQRPQFPAGVCDGRALV